MRRVGLLAHTRAAALARCSSTTTTAAAAADGGVLRLAGQQMVTEVSTGAVVPARTLWQHGDAPLVLTALRHFG
jgi:hypothetical protein